MSRDMKTLGALRWMVMFAFALVFATPAEAQAPQREPVPEPPAQAPEAPEAPEAVTQEQVLPQGPRDVLTQAREDTDRREQARMNPTEQRALRRAMGRPQPVARHEADPAIAVGAIKVTVVDHRDIPVEGAVIRLGLMARDGGRESANGQTARDGTYTFTDLVTRGQSYRVNVLHDGATYSSSPFQLPQSSGMAVRVRRLPTTREENTVFQMIGQTMLEVQNERMHITQQAQLVNFRDATYVFPEEGLQVELPDGFVGFNGQKVMSDQRLEANERGFVIRGSLPPGRVILTWTFDIPITGDAMHFSQPLPVPTFRYRVLSDYAPGITLSVDEFPPPEKYEANGRSVFLTELERRPEDPRLSRIAVTIRGIPGPGPYRWLAIGAGAILLLMGFTWLFRPAEATLIAAAREDRREELLKEISELEHSFAKGEIGPRYRDRTLNAKVDELASLLRLDAAMNER